MSQQRFTKVIGKDQLLALAHKIKPDLPHSVSMYNHLLVHGRGHSHSDTFYVLSNNPDSHAVMWLRKEQRMDAGFFCRPQEVGQLTKALMETPLVDWSEFLMFYHVSDYLVGPLQKVAKDLGDNPLRTWPLYTFTYHPHLDNGPIRCGAGLRVCRLGKAGVQHLMETNKFIKNDPLEPMWRYVQKVPAVGVYLDPNVTENTLVDPDDLPCAGDEELPVSWVTTTMQGSIGRLETQEEYRKRGLGSLAMRVVARLQAEQGYIPHARIDVDNSASLAMFRKKPEWIYTHTVARMAPASFDFL